MWYGCLDSGFRQEGKAIKLFIDSANIDEVRSAYDLGVISGVTTNPSLIAREGRDFAQVVREITAIVDGPVSAEAVSTTAAEMIAEAGQLAQDLEAAERLPGECGQ